MEYHFLPLAKMQQEGEVGPPPYSPSFVGGTGWGYEVSQILVAGNRHRRSGESRNPEWQPCVYLLASKRNGTLYVGVTSHLAQRVWQHRNDLVEGFTKQYGVHTLVWYEAHATMESAIAREKAIKEWRRVWKMALIEEANPQWRDPNEELASLDSGFRRKDESNRNDEVAP